MRRAAKIDDNQTRIVAELRALPGVTVSLGHDDIMVGYDHPIHGKRNFWFEIKNPQRCLNKKGELRVGALRATQIDLLNSWRGHFAVAWTTEMITKEMDYVL